MAYTQYTADQRAMIFYNRNMVDYLAWNMSGRQYYSKVTAVPQGKWFMEFDRIQPMSAAQISYSLPDDTTQRDEFTTTEEKIQLPVIHKSWQIQKDRWDAWESGLGINLPTADQQEAVKQIGILETQMLIQGYVANGTDTKIKGLYLGAGTSVTDTYDFDTSGNAKAAISAGLAKIRAQKVVNINHNLILNYSEFEKLSGNFINGFVREIDVVRDLLNMGNGPAPGTITWSPYITAGTGLLTPADPQGRFIDLLIGQPMTTDIGRNSKMPTLSPVYGTAYEVLIPRILHDEAICTLNDLGA